MTSGTILNRRALTSRTGTTIVKDKGGERVVIGHPEINPYSTTVYRTTGRRSPIRNTTGLLTMTHDVSTMTLMVEVMVGATTGSPHITMQRSAECHPLMPLAMAGTTVSDVSSRMGDHRGDYERSEAARHYARQGDDRSRQRETAPRGETSHYGPTILHVARSVIMSHRNHR
jgi:hypothetical protein